MSSPSTNPPTSSRKGETSTPLILVDGSSYLYRAFHAMPPLQTSSGQPTGAIRGVLSMLRRLIKDHNPQKMMVVFDAKGKTFRDDLYSEYKANRPPMPDELRAQVDPLYEAIKAMGLPLVAVPGVEADDVIGTLCRLASGQGISTLVSTGDKDLAQLVNDHVTLVNTMTDVTMDHDGVVEKFGVPPELIIDYLALVGDSVDNVPGVPKVGPKTAVKWLSQYGTLDSIMENAGEFKGKVGEYLRDSLATLPMSKELVTIKCDVALDDGLDACTLGQPDQNHLAQLYRDFEFKGWLSELLDASDGSIESALSENDNKSDSESNVTKEKTQHEIIYEVEALDALIDALNQAPFYAVDTETTSLNYMDAQIVGLSFSLKAGHAYYIPLAHDYNADKPQLDREETLAKLKPLLEDNTAKKIGQNLKYDQHVLANHGIHLRGIAFDTMLESYILDSTATRHDMDSLALKYLGMKTISFEEVAGKGVKQKTFNQVDINIAAEYAAEDADITLRLHQTLWPSLEKVDSLRDVYQNIEIPLAPVLQAMEHHGTLIDAKVLNEQSAELDTKLKQLQQEAYDMAGREFNLASTKQLGEVLYDELDLPVLKKTPKGKPSTGEEVLQELALDYPLPKLLLEYRSFSKLKSTYTDKLPELVNARTGRVHTSYHQAVAATGRLSSSDPNLQNIPIRTEEGRRIRKAFVAPEGFIMMAADYSQIELRIMAHLSGDPHLVEAFANGEDVHRATASEVFAVDVDQVTADQRRHAKAVNFGLIYGMSAFGLAKQLSISRHDAKHYIDRYFERYPGVRDYMDRTRADAAENGFVETLRGRRLYLPEIRSRNKMRVKAAERTAINAPMQGTAADIIKCAMINVFDWLTSSKKRSRLVMQVHDELVLEVANDERDEVEVEVQRIMSDAIALDVPLLVDVGMGQSWEEAH